VRSSQLTLKPPRNHSQRQQLLPIDLNAILVEEENVSSDVEPIRWLLLTTLKVEAFDELVRCIRWYSYRWLIERYHYVLKSGCGLEQLQLETSDRIIRALATYSIVAWRLLWLTYESRVNGQQPCDTVLEDHEWQALYCHVHNCLTLPPVPPSLHQTVRWIAQLGGFLGRIHDGEPGVKTIWRGLRRLHDIASTWKLLNSNSLSHQPFDSYG
jgi:Transposase Tn5 dimerisation domain